jgi:hypothetical protein
MLLFQHIQLLQIIWVYVGIQVRICREVTMKMMMTVVELSF